MDSPNTVHNSNFFHIIIYNWKHGTYWGSVFIWNCNIKISLYIVYFYYVLKGSTLKEKNSSCINPLWHIYPPKVGHTNLYNPSHSSFYNVTNIHPGPCGSVGCSILLCTQGSQVPSHVGGWGVYRRQAINISLSH